MYAIVKISEHKFNLYHEINGEMLLKNDVSLLQAIMMLNYINGGSISSPEFSEFLATLF